MDSVCLTMLLVVLNLWRLSWAVKRVCFPEWKGCAVCALWHSVFFLFACLLWFVSCVKRRVTLVRGCLRNIRSTLLELAASRWLRRRQWPRPDALLRRVVSSRRNVASSIQ